MHETFNFGKKERYLPGALKINIKDGGIENMTRLEMLKWMWKNCYDNTSARYYVDVRNYIGDDYYNELKDMGFIIGFHNESYSYVHLSPLGRAYCDEIFS